jgi:hypothetical protein
VFTVPVRSAAAGRIGVVSAPTGSSARSGLLLRGKDFQLATPPS